MNQGNDLFDPASLIVAHDETHAFEAVVPPLVQTSLFTFPSYDDMVTSYRGEKVRPIYTRGLNPTDRNRVMTDAATTPSASDSFSKAFFW